MNPHIDNIKRAVPDAIADEIRLKRSKVYSRHLFYSPLYHECAAQHAAAALRNLPDKDHAEHDAFHYNDDAVSDAVKRRLNGLKKKFAGNANALAAIDAALKEKK